MSHPTVASRSQGSSWLPSFFWPTVSETVESDPQEIRRRYAHHRPRILFWSTVGYGTFYFVRKNLSVAMPIMQDQLHLDKKQLGMILTLHGVLYGVSKFLNGMAADRANARIFMPTALIICAVLNLFFGLSTSMLFLGTFWMLNGWFQGMGYPPCARLLTHWFAPRELASKMAVWNTSHSLGGAGIVLLCAYLLTWTHDWRICFFVPAGIALVMGVLLLINLRDTPESLALPPVERTPVPPVHAFWFCVLIVAYFAVIAIGYDAWRGELGIILIIVAVAMCALLVMNLAERPEPVLPPEPPTEAVAEAKADVEQSDSDFGAMLRRQVFSNPYIWLVSIANFSVYTIRFAIFDWGPTLLKEYKQIPLHDAALIVAGFEVAGLFGMLSTGWLTDRFFKGRGVPLCLISMLCCGATIFVFWKSSSHAIWLNTALLAAAGFFIYGPQALLAVVAANLATKHAAATAVGLTSIFGYASTVLSGWGLGWLAQNYGWQPAFAALVAIAIFGAILFAAALPAKSDGYDDAAVH